MSDLRRCFARRLKALRIDRGLTQAELADRISVSTGFVSTMERGINAPSFETLELLAEVLGTTVRDLFEFRDQKQGRI